MHSAGKLDRLSYLRQSITVSRLVNGGNRMVLCLDVGVETNIEWKARQTG